MDSAGWKETTLSYWGRHGQVSLIRISSLTLSPIQPRTAWHIAVAVDKRQFDPSKSSWHNNIIIYAFRLLLCLPGGRQTIEKPNPVSNYWKCARKGKRKKTTVIIISFKWVAVADDFILHMLDESLLGIVCGTGIGFGGMPI